MQVAVAFDVQEEDLVIIMNSVTLLFILEASKYLEVHLITALRSQINLVTRSILVSARLHGLDELL